MEPKDDELSLICSRPASTAVPTLSPSYLSIHSLLSLFICRIHRAYLFLSFSYSSSFGCLSAPTTILFCFLLRPTLSSIFQPITLNPCRLGCQGIMDTSALWRREDTIDQFLQLIQDPFKSAVSIVCALIYFYFFRPLFHRRPTVHLHTWVSPWSHRTNLNSFKSTLSGLRWPPPPVLPSSLPYSFRCSDLGTRLSTPLRLNMQIANIALPRWEKASLPGLNRFCARESQSSLTALVLMPLSSCVSPRCVAISSSS